MFVLSNIFSNMFQLRLFCGAKYCVGIFFPDHVRRIDDEFCHSNICHQYNVIFYSLYNKNALSVSFCLQSFCVAQLPSIFVKLLLE